MAQTLRVVLDTNVLLSGLAYAGSVPGKIVAAWRMGALDVVLSDFILEELRRVLPRLHHRHGLSAAEIDELLDILVIQADVLTPLPVQDKDTTLRDPNDVPILGTLLAAREAVDYLITGDKDLLVLAPRYPVISPADFWARHGGA